MSWETVEFKLLELSLIILYELIGINLTEKLESREEPIERIKKRSVFGC